MGTDREFSLVGGHPALDLVNTVGWRPDPSRTVDHLPDLPAAVRWAVAAGLLDDAAAGVPMLPAVAPLDAVARKILLYCALTVASSLALWPLAHTGVVYAVAAIALGAVLLFEAVVLLVRANRYVAADASGGNVSVAQVKPMRLFHWSNMYAALLFVAVAVDALLGW